LGGVKDEALRFKGSGFREDPTDDLNRNPNMPHPPFQGSGFRVRSWCIVAGLGLAKGSGFRVRSCPLADFRSRGSGSAAGALGPCLGFRDLGSGIRLLPAVCLDSWLCSASVATVAVAVAVDVAVAVSVSASVRLRRPPSPRPLSALCGSS